MWHSLYSYNSYTKQRGLICSQQLAAKSKLVNLKYCVTVALLVASEFWSSVPFARFSDPSGLIYMYNPVTEILVVIEYERVVVNAVE